MNGQNSEKPIEPKQTSDVAGVVDDVTALNAAFPAQGERRQVPRLKYQVVATLEPVAVGPDDVRVVTRDADPKGTGFVSSGPIAEGARAVLHLPAPEGQPDAEPQRIECRVRRSREIGNGLFEGSVEFVGEQPQFSDTRIKPTIVRPR